MRNTWQNKSHVCNYLLMNCSGPRFLWKEGSLEISTTIFLVIIFI